MPRPDLTDITIVLDRSGSMSSAVDDTLGGFNTFLDAQKKLPGSANLTLIQFDHEYQPVHRAVPVGSVPPLTRETFVPRGNTALLDAMGRAIVEAGSRLDAIPEGDRPGKVIFVVLTDGYENSSCEYDRPKVNAMISHQRETYAWEFVFLGANQDAIAAASSIGIPSSNAMTYANNQAGNRAAYEAVHCLVATARSGGRASFTDEDRRRQREAMKA
jgi:hypothetical protein